MLKPKDHIHEEERLKSLLSYSILDTFSEADYDNITSIAAQICETPISLISLVDDKRQWFKSRHGLNATETSKDLAFCAHAINSPEKIFTVPDARIDERFHDNPLVTGDPKVVFYSGISLISDEGYPLGTLCVIDHKPRVLTETQKLSLNALSNQVLNLLTLRKVNNLLKDTMKVLEDKNKELENFAKITAHDIKLPLISISNISKLFINDERKLVKNEGKEIMKMIMESTDNLLTLVDGLLQYSLCENLLHTEKVSIPAESLISELNSFFAVEKDKKINFEISCKEIIENKPALNQILMNLISNAIRYNDKDQTEINISIAENGSYYEFSVRDNGPGIDPSNYDKIFDIFTVTGIIGKNGQTGNGIGLATVKKLVNRMGGTIQVESEMGKGTTFYFTLLK
jgi:signal transduction histidine kinase